MVSDISDRIEQPSTEMEQPSRAEKLIKRLGPGPKSARKTGFSELRALVKSLVFQSLASYGSSYRKFNLGILLKHTEFYPKAIHTAISGEHLIKMTQHSLEAEKIKEDLAEKASYYEKRIIEGNGMFEKIQKETQKFLRNAARKIEKMPADYRNMLMANYRQIKKGIASLLAKYQTSTA